MTGDSLTLRRRERNKFDKVTRITAAAGELFAERGVDDVTTQEIADRSPSRSERSFCSDLLCC